MCCDRRGEGGKEKIEEKKRGRHFFFPIELWPNGKLWKDEKRKKGKTTRCSSKIPVLEGRRQKGEALGGEKKKRKEKKRGKKRKKKESEFSPRLFLTCDYRGTEKGGGKFGERGGKEGAPPLEPNASPHRA